MLTTRYLRRVASDLALVLLVGLMAGCATPTEPTYPNEAARRAAFGLPNEPVPEPLPTTAAQPTHTTVPTPAPAVAQTVAPGTPTTREDAPEARPPQTPSRPTDPSPEICAKVREARKRLKYYLDQSLTQAKLDRLAAEQELTYTKMGYRPIQIQGLMASTYRDLERSRRVVQDAKAVYDRLADDLIGKVETPWPACEAPQ
jgi:hypothetical protein